MTGLDILRQLRQTDQDTVVIMVTAYSTVETAVEAMKHGAFDYIAKPFHMDELALLVAKGLEQTALKRQVARLRRHWLSSTASTASSASHQPCRSCSR